MSQGNLNLEVTHIVEAAQRLGVQLDETAAMQWLTAITAARASGNQITVDVTNGVYGMNVSMLDFDARDLERYRRIGAIVGVPNSDGVETALSLSGSAAQSRIQLFPGDCDYFERVNIKAETREQACDKLGQIVHAKVHDKLRGQDYQCVAVKLGRFPTDVVRNGKPREKGFTIEWAPAEAEAGELHCFTADGQPLTITWAEAARDPGWCKLDWLVAEPEHARVISATNVLDATWEAPDGHLTPLDGFLDPYFQEVYLDAASIPLFTKISQHVSPQALDNYVEQLRHEVLHYVKQKPNFGKAAKRMYNIFRLTGRYQEAAFIRELFNEPAARLYQVWALLDTLEWSGEDATRLDQAVSIAEIDDLIKTVVEIAEGPRESEIVLSLLKLRDIVAGRRELGADWASAIETSRREVALMVNDYFREKLYAIPQVAEYLAQFGEDVPEAH